MAQKVAFLYWGKVRRICALPSDRVVGIHQPTLPKVHVRLSHCARQRRALIGGGDRVVRVLREVYAVAAPGPADVFDKLVWVRQAHRGGRGEDVKEIVLVAHSGLTVAPLYMNVCTSPCTALDQLARIIE